MAGKFEVRKAKNGQFYFNLKAGNGEILLTSEQYTARKSVKKGIAAVQKNAADPTRFDRRRSKKGEPYFVLRAGNHQPIGTSEMYTSVTEMETGIKSIQRTAPGARVDDLS